MFAFAEHLCYNSVRNSNIPLKTATDGSIPAFVGAAHSILNKK